MITGASGSAYGMRLVEQLARGPARSRSFRSGRRARLTATSWDCRLPGKSEARGRSLAVPRPPRDRALPRGRSRRPLRSCGFGLAVRRCGHRRAGDRWASSVRRLRPCERPARTRSRCRAQGATAARGRSAKTPLNLIHLRNLTALAEAGAVVLPAMPAFYQRPGSVDDLVNFVVGKVLDVLGLEHDLFKRWGDHA